MANSGVCTLLASHDLTEIIELREASREAAREAAQAKRKRADKAVEFAVSEMRTPVTRLRTTVWILSGLIAAATAIVNIEPATIETLVGLQNPSSQLHDVQTAVSQTRQELLESIRSLNPPPRSALEAIEEDIQNNPESHVGKAIEKSCFSSVRNHFSERFLNTYYMVSGFIDNIYDGNLFDVYINRIFPSNNEPESILYTYAEEISGNEFIFTDIKDNQKLLQECSIYDKYLIRLDRNNKEILASYINCELAKLEAFCKISNVISEVAGGPFQKWLSEGFSRFCQTSYMRYVAHLSGGWDILPQHTHVTWLRRISIGVFGIMVLANALVQVKKRRTDTTIDLITSNVQRKDIYYELIKTIFGDRFRTGWPASEGIQATREWCKNNNREAIDDIGQMKRFIARTLGPATFYRMIADVGLSNGFLKEVLAQETHGAPTVVFRLNVDD